MDRRGFLRSLSILTLPIALTGCHGDNEPTGFNIVEKYSNEITSADLRAVITINNFITESSSLTENTLQTRMDKINSVESNFLEDPNFPSYQEIETWEFQRNHNGKTWTLNGEKLSTSLQNVETLNQDLVSSLQNIIDAGLTIDEMDTSQVNELDRLSNEGPSILNELQNTINRRTLPNQ